MLVGGEVSGGRRAWMREFGRQSGSRIHEARSPSFSLLAMLIGRHCSFVHVKCLRSDGQEQRLTIMGAIRHMIVEGVLVV